MIDDGGVDLSGRLKLLRAATNATQAEVAAAVGVAERTYRGYEAGTCEPDLKGLVALADYFNVPLDQLVGRDKFLV